MRQRQPLLVNLVGHGRQRCGELVLAVVDETAVSFVDGPRLELRLDTRTVSAWDVTVRPSRALPPGSHLVTARKYALVPADLWAVALGHARAATTRRSAEFFLTLDSTGVYALPPAVWAAPASSTTPSTVSLAAAARLVPDVARWLADTFTLDPAAADVAFAALTARG